MNVKQRPDKQTLEMLAVVGLLGVFAVTLVTGPLKSLGLMGQASAATAAPAGGQPGDTPEVWQESPAASPAPPIREPRPALYAAAALRDPLQSLLPSPPAAETAAVVAPAAAQPAEAPPPPKPPALQVTGLLWGGPRPQAIIGGHVYGIGDPIVKGTTVLAIDREGILVDCRGVTVRYTTTVGPRPQGGSPSQEAHQWR
jgi:hypothetical protein